MALDNYTGSISAAASVDACGSFNYSTCHDYTLRVITGAYHITCVTPDYGTISVNYGTADEGQTITVTAVPDTNYELATMSYNDGSDHNINFSNNQGSFTMPAADVTVSATFSIIRNLPPYNLTYGIPDGYSITLGWTGVSTNTNHQNFEVYHSTTNVAPSDDLTTGYDVGYYSYTWTAILDADAFEAFAESGDLFNPELAKKFRHLLESGNTIEPMDLYRAFRGKDPSPKALLKRKGML